MVKNDSNKHGLNWQEIESGLLERSLSYVTHHEILDQVDSTNNRALGVCGRAKELPVIYLAEQQLHGRGRNGRIWHSPRGGNIYMSLASVFQCPVAKLTGLSIAIGVEMARMLRHHGLDVALKWPNDILVDGQKLAGILVETRVKDKNQVCVVMGVGLNYSMGDRDVANINQLWTDLIRVMQGMPMPNRNLIAAEMINALVNVCIEFPAAGLNHWLDTWSELDVCNNRKLEVIEGDSRYIGTGAGITEKGALRVRVDGEIRAIHSSEVSIRVIN
ncbi:MAG: biotin--[acetyl-CoA-carboxylase] ligase [Gammaproteobacteria bacterium]